MYVCIRDLIRFDIIGLDANRNTIWIPNTEWLNVVRRMGYADGPMGLSLRYLCPETKSNKDPKYKCSLSSVTFDRRETGINVSVHQHQI
jgi:hypothetical protein